MADQYVIVTGKRLRMGQEIDLAPYGRRDYKGKVISKAVKTPKRS